MRFRKKPIVIEAFQMTADAKQGSLPPWLKEAMAKGRDAEGALWGTTLNGGGIYVNTKEGPLRVSENDWIIRGVQGELYPIKPDIMAETYDPVREDEAT